MIGGIAGATDSAVLIGCSGWSYDHWAGTFYPEEVPRSRWLSHYASRFDTVEINSTFYRLASGKAVERWVATTPEDFVFTVKASRYLTHVKRLVGIAKGVERFYAPLRPLAEAGRLGPTLWQLPETFHRDDERLAAALDRLPEGHRQAFEFRHPSWFADEVYEALEGRGAALVIGDDPNRPFQKHRMTAGWTLIRFHRGSHGRGGNYSRRELEEWARRIKRWSRDGDVYAYFNNDWETYAPRNATLLRRLVGA